MLRFGKGWIVVTFLLTQIVLPTTGIFHWLFGGGGGSSRSSTKTCPHKPQDGTAYEQSCSAGYESCSWYGLNPLYKEPTFRVKRSPASGQISYQRSSAIGESQISPYTIPTSPTPFPDYPTFPTTYTPPTPKYPTDYPYIPDIPLPPYQAKYVTLYGCVSLPTTARPVNKPAPSNSNLYCGRGCQHEYCGGRMICAKPGTCGGCNKCYKNRRSTTCGLGY